MKKIALFSLLMACLPFMAMAQNDDLYFIPKKKTEKKEKVTTSTKWVEAKPVQSSVITESASPVVVVKDVKGEVRDIDEYNRRYTSRDNTFSYENDTLYIEEKPYDERGEWINGFNGSQSDYDYAMRIVRFRNPRFAVSVSSPFYWDVMSLGYSWDWNVYDDGFYVYAFPTYSNSLWWDWRFNYPWRYSYYSGWYCSPSWYYGGYWGGGWRPPHIHHSHWHHFPPHYAHGGVGGYWGGGHGWYGSSAHNPGIHSGRYTDNHRRESFPARAQTTRTERNSRNGYVGGTRRTSQSTQTVNRNNGNSVRTSTGRVVKSRDASSSVRPQRSATRSRSGQAVNSGTTSTRSSSVYTRQSQGRSSSYNRASSTRRTVTNSSGSWGGRSGNGGVYNNSSSSSGSSSRGSSVSSGSSRSSSSGSFSSGRSGGAGRSAGTGGSSRSSGGRR